MGIIGFVFFEGIFGGLDICLDICGENNNVFRDFFLNFMLYNSCKVKCFYYFNIM